MGTLGKALGSFGAYVAGSRPLIDWLANRARSFVFTTALPPAAVGAARAALHLLQAEPELRVRLHENAQRLWELLRAVGADVPRQASHILPVLVGEERRTMELSEGLLREGVWVQGIRPPTVPPGSSRLRVTATAALQETDWEFVRRAFSRVLSKE
jgi:7-keto-8-aminopelargonate synthetase-like enzyme